MSVFSLFFTFLLEFRFHFFVKDVKRNLVFWLRDSQARNIQRTAKPHSLVGSPQYLHDNS